MMAGNQESTRTGVPSQADSFKQWHSGQHPVLPDSALSQAPTRALAAAQRTRSALRARFAYIDGVLPDGDLQPLFRLRYGGSAHYWGFAFYAGGSAGYEDSMLPNGAFAGTP